MATTIQRMIHERNQADSEPLEVVQSDPFSYDIVGAASDDLNKYGGLASSALLEVASSAMKSKEDAAKAAAYANSDAGKAAATAKDARMKANLAAADAMGELDANGPKHKAATELELTARAAEAKAAVYAPPGGSGGAGPSGQGGHGGASFFSQYKIPLLIGGGVLGLLTIVLIARRK